MSDAHTEHVHHSNAYIDQHPGRVQQMIRIRVPSRHEHIQWQYSSFVWQEHNTLPTQTLEHWIPMHIDLQLVLEQLLHHGKTVHITDKYVFDLTSMTQTNHYGTRRSIRRARW